MFISLLLLSFKFFAVPIGDAEQFFCSIDNPTIANIVVSGNPIYWFQVDDNSGTVLSETTALVNNTVYYAFDSLDAGAQSLAVTVYIQQYIPAPEGETFVYSCEVSNMTLADLPVFNTGTFDGIYWYDSDNQVTGNLLYSSTILQNNVTYYAFQAFCNCSAATCMDFLPVTVYLIPDVPAPIGEISQTFCISQNATLNDIAISNTSSYTTIYWSDNPYCQANQALSPNTPLETGVTYYAYQVPENTCCPPSLAVTVTIDDCSMSVDNNETFNFNVKPNPVNNYLYIDFITVQTDYSVSIYNVLGKRVFNKKITNNLPKINTSNLAKGVYFVKVDTTNFSMIRKVIKN